MSTRKRVNVHVDNQQYEIFKKLSGLLNLTFTDLVNDSLKQFNDSVLAAINTGSAEGMIEFYRKQLEQTNKELLDVTNDISHVDSKRIETANDTVQSAKNMLNENL